MGEKRKLICPKCGSLGPFRYLEEITVWRKVRGFNAGVLEIVSFAQSGEGYDDGENPRFECRYDSEGTLDYCMHEFPVPDGVELDWI